MQCEFVDHWVACYKLLLNEYCIVLYCIAVRDDKRNSIRFVDRSSVARLGTSIAAPKNKSRGDLSERLVTQWGHGHGDGLILRLQHKTGVDDCLDVAVNLCWEKPEPAAQLAGTDDKSRPEGPISYRQQWQCGLAWPTLFTVFAFMQLSKRTL